MAVYLEQINSYREIYNLIIDGLNRVNEKLNSPAMLVRMKWMEMFVIYNGL